MKTNWDMRRDGFTLIELMAVVAVIAILGVITISVMKFANYKAAIHRMEVDMQGIRNGLESYRIRHGEYPDPYGDDFTNTLGHILEQHRAMKYVYSTYNVGGGPENPANVFVGFLPRMFPGYMATVPLLDDLQGVIDPDVVNTIVHSDGHACPFYTLEGAPNSKWRELFPYSDSSKRDEHDRPIQSYNLRGFVDPWEQPYFYGREGPYSYVLFSLGPQKKSSVGGKAGGGVAQLFDMNFTIKEDKGDESGVIDMTLVAGADPSSISNYIIKILGNNLVRDVDPK